jgi:hypothetical protein
LKGAEVVAKIAQLTSGEITV